MFEDRTRHLGAKEPAPGSKRAQNQASAILAAYDPQQNSSRLPEGFTFAEEPLRYARVFLLVSLVFGPLAALSQTSETGDKLEVVRDFVAAFNAHDAAAMSALVTDDVQWLSVRGSEVSIELEGKAPFAAAMDDYFTSCPSCRSEILSEVSSNERVSMVEVASWDGPDGPRSQQSMAVYEFAGSLIRRVYYFPEETVPDKADLKSP